MTKHVIFDFFVYPIFFFYHVLYISGLFQVNLFQEKVFLVILETSFSIHISVLFLFTSENMTFQLEFFEKTFLTSLYSALEWLRLAMEECHMLIKQLFLMENTVTLITFEGVFLGMDYF